MHMFFWKSALRIEIILVVLVPGYFVMLPEPEFPPIREHRVFAAHFLPLLLLSSMLGISVHDLPYCHVLIREPPVKAC